MASSFNIDLGDLNDLKDRLNAIPDNLTPLIDGIIMDGCNRIALRAKQLAPADDGILRETINVDQLALMIWEVSANALYSPYVEFGTRTSVVIPDGLEEYASQFMGPSSSTSDVKAKDAIFEWCRHKGIEEEYWYAIFIKIMVQGINPHPFFFPAVNEILPSIVNDIQRVLERGGI